jgi:predicted dehydrogenase
VPDAQGRAPALERQPMLAGLKRMLLMEVMIHHLDALDFLLGPLALRASALGRISPAIAGEDCATLCLALPRGGLVSLAGNFSARGYPPALFDQLEILGEAGSIRLADDVLTLEGRRRERQRLDLAANYKLSYRRHRAFLGLH